MRSLKKILFKEEHAFVRVAYIEQILHFLNKMYFLLIFSKEK